MKNLEHTIYFAEILEDVLNFKVQFQKDTTDGLGFEFIAGGTDVQDRINLGLASGKFVDISGIKELQKIEETETELKIGSLVTLTELLENKYIQSQPGLVNALSHIATPQIRNVATIGGNLFQKPRFTLDGNNRRTATFKLLQENLMYPSTLGLVLASLDVKVVGDDDIRIPFSEFNPKSSILAFVYIPKAYQSEKLSYLRLTKRRLGEWPYVELFSRLRFEEDLHTVEFAKIVVGAMATKPIILVDVNDFLRGKVLDGDVLHHALDLLSNDPIFGQIPSKKLQSLRNALVALLNTKKY